MIFTVIISNKVRILVWVLILSAGILASRNLDTIVTLYIKCNLLCQICGAVLLFTVFLTSHNTGRWLSRCGKPTKRAGFGEIGRLVREGPYSCMRHPMHFFLALIPIALGLLLNSPSMTLIIGPAEFLLILLLAIKVDEAESIERFGEEYLRYRREVPAFNLSIKCLAKVFTLPPKDVCINRFNTST